MFTGKIGKNTRYNVIIFIRLNISIPNSNVHDANSKQISPTNVKIDPPGINERQKLTMAKNGERHIRLVIMTIDITADADTDKRHTVPQINA